MALIDKGFEDFRLVGGGKQLLAKGKGDHLIGVAMLDQQRRCDLRYA